MNTENFSITELAEAVNDWCKQHQVEPLHNQVGAQVSVRNIRYYQGLGLVDRPVNARGKGFVEKHRLQLIAIRLLQAKGVPLGKIQSLLSGRTLEQLREVERRGLVELEGPPPPAWSWPQDWKLVQLNQDLLLLARSAKELTPTQKQRILDILNPPPENFAPAEEEGFRPEID